MNWVDWAQDRDYKRALVNAVLNLRVSLALDLVSCRWLHYSLKSYYYVLYVSFCSDPVVTRFELVLWDAALVPCPLEEESSTGV